MQSFTEAFLLSRKPEIWLLAVITVLYILIGGEKAYKTEDSCAIFIVTGTCRFSLGVRPHRREFWVMSITT